MKTYVLDTHVFVWYVRGRRLGKDAARALRDVDAGRARVWLPAIVAVELALLYDRRRSAIGVPELEATMLRNPESRLLPLDLAQAKEFALLSAVHDPFDRLVIAAARSSGCPLLSADEAIAASGLVHVVWTDRDGGIRENRDLETIGTILVPAGRMVGIGPTWGT